MAGLILFAAGPLAAGLPPLTAEQRIRLETAVDGRDHQEEAFLALLENAAEYRTETPGSSGDPPDLDRLISDPDRHRGQVVRLRGRLEQVTQLPRPFDQAWEWCVRTDERIALVYLPAAATITPAPLGATVEMDGRFYKTIDAAAFAGDVRPYPAFVGAGVEVVPDPRHAVPGGMVFAVIALALGGLGLAIAVRAARRSPRRPRRVASPPRIDTPEAEADLPEDPAEALIELRRRRTGDAP